MEKDMSRSQVIKEQRLAVIPASRPWLMLLSRSAFFLLFQLVFALIFALAGSSGVWQESARWWTFMAIFTNLVSIYLLVRVYRAEGKRYLDAVKFSKPTWKKDVFWFIGASIICMQSPPFP